MAVSGTVITVALKVTATEAVKNRSNRPRRVFPFPGSQFFSQPLSLG